MPIKIGEVEALFRFPVKSMRGEAVKVADLGWHGLDGDRRLALRRAEDRSGFPWLRASMLPELLLLEPRRLSTEGEPGLPTHVRTPEGEELEVFGPKLVAELSQRHGSPVEMMRLDGGIFDDSSVSVISAATVEEVGRLAGQGPEVRRFRPNILVHSKRERPFEEDEWVGGLLFFGQGEQAGVIAPTKRNERCAMLNLDPDSARSAPEVLKAVARTRENRAGIYGTVVRRGRLAVGQPVFFQPAEERLAPH